MREGSLKGEDTCESDEGSLQHSKDCSESNDKRKSICPFSLWIILSNDDETMNSNNDVAETGKVK